MPKVLIFAGANGSGKTTLANSILEPGLKFINADDIQGEGQLSDIDAGKEALKMIDLSISKRKDFALETTMAGLGLRKRFEHLKQAKYLIIIYYLFVHPVDLLVERIKERLKRGGHPVSEKDVIRRYPRSLRNFWTQYRLCADEWNIVNNNEVEARNIVIGKKKDFQVLDNAEFDIFKEVLKNA